MLIWLGKPYLGQSDKRATQATGANDSPLIPQSDDDPRASLERELARIIAGAEPKVST